MKIIFKSYLFVQPEWFCMESFYKEQYLIFVRVKEHVLKLWMKRFCSLYNDTVCNHWFFLQFSRRALALLNLSLYLPAGREASDDPRRSGPLLDLDSFHFGGKCTQTFCNITIVEY